MAQAEAGSNEVKLTSGSSLTSLRGALSVAAEARSKRERGAGATAVRSPHLNRKLWPVGSVTVSDPDGTKSRRSRRWPRFETVNSPVEDDLVDLWLAILGRHLPYHCFGRLIRQTDSLYRGLILSESLNVNHHTVLVAVDTKRRRARNIRGEEQK
jgi:hypothetical protein